MDPNPTPPDQTTPQEPSELRSILRASNDIDSKLNELTSHGSSSADPTIEKLKTRKSEISQLKAQLEQLKNHTAEYRPFLGSRAKRELLGICNQFYLDVEHIAMTSAVLDTSEAELETSPLDIYGAMLYSQTSNGDIEGAKQTLSYMASYLHGVGGAEFHDEKEEIIDAQLKVDDIEGAIESRKTYDPFPDSYDHIEIDSRIALAMIDRGDESWARTVLEEAYKNTSYQELRKSISAYETDSTIIHGVRALANIALGWAKLGETDKAKDIFGESRRLIDEKMFDSKFDYEALENISLAQTMAGFTVDAQASFDEAMTIIDNEFFLNDDPLRNNLLKDMADSQAQIGNVDNAIEAISKSPLVPFKIQQLFEVAMEALKRNDTQGAQKAFAKARRILPTIPPDKKNERENAQERFNFYSAQLDIAENNFTEAEAKLEKFYQRIISHSDDFFKSYDLSELANVWIKTGNIVKFEELYSEAQDSIKKEASSSIKEEPIVESEYFAHKAEIYIARAESLSKEGYLSRAIEALREARDCTNKIPLESMKFYCLSKTAGLAYKIAQEL